MKTSSYFTIAISIVLAVSVTIVILFVNDVSIKDSHRNSRVPENDLFCGTEWTVKMKEALDFKIFEQILREEIAKFGWAYDKSQRDIELFDLGENRVRIVIEGLWGIEPDRPNLKTSIAEIEFVDYIEEFVGGPVRAWYQ